MQSMEEIYQQYSNTVYKYLVCLTGDQQIAEDLTRRNICDCSQKNSSISWRMQSIDLAMPDCQTFVV